MANWYTRSDAANDWAELPAGQRGDDLLAAARIQCEAFAPDLPAGTRSIPETWRMAHLMQAKAIWQAQQTGNANPSGDFESSGQTVRVYPMDWNVKSLLRPALGAPLIG